MFEITSPISTFKHIAQQPVPTFLYFKLHLQLIQLVRAILLYAFCALLQPGLALAAIEITEDEKTISRSSLGITPEKARQSAERELIVAERDEKKILNRSTSRNSKSSFSEKRKTGTSSSRTLTESKSRSGSSSGSSRTTLKDLFKKKDTSRKSTSDSERKKRITKKKKIAAEKARRRATPTAKRKLSTATESAKKTPATQIGPDTQIPTPTTRPAAPQTEVTTTETPAENVPSKAAATEATASPSDVAESAAPESPDAGRGSDTEEAAAGSGGGKPSKESVARQFGLPGNAATNEKLSAKDIADIANNMAMFGSDDGSDRDVTSEAFWEKVKTQGAGKAIKDAVTDAFNLPDNVKDNDDLTAGDITDIMGEMTKYTSEDGTDTDVNSEKFWEKVKSEGYDAAKKGAFGKQYGLPENAARNKELSAEDLAQGVSKLEMYNQEGYDVEDPALWDRVAKEGLKAVLNAALKKFEGGIKKDILNNALNGENKTGLGNIKKPGTNINGAKESAKAGLGGNAPTPGNGTGNGLGIPGSTPRPDQVQPPGSIPGNIGQTPGTQAGLGNGGTGTAGAAGGSSSSRVPGASATSDHEKEQAWGVGAPGSGSTGIGGNEDGEGLGISNAPSHDGDEAPRSGSAVVIVHNEDGGFSMLHYYVVDGGDEGNNAAPTYGYDENGQAILETYSPNEDGTFTNQFGDEYEGLGDDAGERPPEGNFGTEYNEDGSFTVYDNDDKDDKDSSSDGDDSSDNGDDSDDGSDDGDDEQETESADAGSDDSEDDSSDAEEESDETPTPDGYATSGPSSINDTLYSRTGGKLGSEEQRNMDRAVEAGTGGQVGAPQSGYDDKPMSAEAQRDNETHIGIRKGGGIDAPDDDNTDVITEADVKNIELKAKGGGVVDPPEGREGNTPTGPIIGGGGLAQQDDDGDNGDVNSNLLNGTIFLNNPAMQQMLEGATEKLQTTIGK